MNSISEFRLLTPRPVAAAPVQDARPAAPTRAPEPGRAQGAEQRLRGNRPEEGPILMGAGAPQVELGFGDFLDLINPLQHIPVVSTIYRAITGDEIGGPAKILGGMLFGGPIGFVASIFETIVAQATGRDLGETVLAAFTDQDAAPAAQVAGASDIRSISARDEAFEDGPPMVTGATVRGIGLDRIEIDKAAQIHAVDGIAGGGSDRPRSALGENLFVSAAQGPHAPDLPVAAGAPVIAVDILSPDAPSPGSQRLVPNLATTDRGFAERMLEALDKYQVLASERYRDNYRAPHRLDLDL